MPASRDGSSPSSRSNVPVHIFTPEYLEYLAERDEPETAPEADTAGPFYVAPHPQGWAVFRQGESLETGHVPVGVFSRKEAALAAAAAMPGTGRRLRYRLSPDPDEHGFPLLLDGVQVGHLRFFDEELLAGLNANDAVLSTPRSLALLLDAAGGLALEHVETIAVARLAGSER